MLYELFNNTDHLNSKSKLFLCSQAVENILPLALTKLGIPNYRIKTVKSRVFGGSIDCAGLLLVEDYIYAIKEFLGEKQNKKPEIVILSSAGFDNNNEDLRMTPVCKIERQIRY